MPASAAIRLAKAPRMIDVRNYQEKDVLKDGTPVTVRAINVTDEIGIATEFSRLDPDSVYTRFFTIKKRLTSDELRQATNVDFIRVVALVVVADSGFGERLIAGGRYYRNLEAAGRSAEVAFMTAGDQRGRGLASLVLKHLIRIAREQGVELFEADVLAHNNAMLRVFRGSGLELSLHRDGSVVHVTMPLATAH